MAVKANREVTVINLSVLRQWQPKPIEKSQNKTISSLAMTAQANREVTVIKPSVLWQWQPKPI